VSTQRSCEAGAFALRADDFTQVGRVNQWMESVRFGDNFWCFVKIPFMKIRKYF